MLCINQLAATGTFSGAAEPAAGSEDRSSGRAGGEGGGGEGGNARAAELAEAAADGAGGGGTRAVSGRFGR